MRRVLVSILATTAAAAAVAVAQPSQATTGPIRYTALGDSYSAASGVLPPDPSASVDCLRSLRNYPHDIAAATGAELTDATCGAAQTKDYFSSQYPDVAPQLSRLASDAQVVTMTIGGNDNNTFIGAIVSCGASGLSTLGQGSPCKDRFGSSFADDIRTKTYPALVKTLKAVHAKAPHAKVAILGYPWILPKTVGCFDKLPVATGDVPYVRGIQATLNDAIKHAAAATGTRYVDFSTASEGHDACKPIGVRWIEPVLQGTNPVIVHPNAYGEQQMASRTMSALGLR